MAKKKKTTQKKTATGSSGPAKAAKSKKTTRKKASASGGERATAKSTKSSKRKTSTPKTAKKSTKKATAKKTSKTSKTLKKKSPAKATTGQKKAGKSKATAKTTAKKAAVKKAPAKRSASKSASQSVTAASNGHAPGLGQASTNGHQPLTDAQMRKVKTGLTKKDLKYFQQLLLEKRAEIVGDVAAMDLSRNGGGELSHMPLHMADIGSDNYEQEFTLGLVESEQKLLREIDEALVRIASGTYGVCVISGVPIGKPRLEVQPWAKYCIEVARQRERRM